MTAQTSYEINTEKGLPGLVADIHNSELVSRNLNEAAGSEFGTAMGRSGNIETEVTSGLGGGFVGISIRDLGREGAANTGKVRYEDSETVGCMRRGNIWAVCPAGCNPGDGVVFANATGILDAQAGNGGAGNTIIDNAFWDTTAAAGEIARIHIANTQTTAGT